MIGQQGSPADGLEKLTRVTVIGNETRRNSAMPRADKSEDMRSDGHSTAIRDAALVIRVRSRWTVDRA